VIAQFSQRQRVCCCKVSFFRFLVSSVTCGNLFKCHFLQCDLYYELRRIVIRPIFVAAYRPFITLRNVIILSTTVIDDSSAEWLHTLPYVSFINERELTFAMLSPVRLSSVCNARAPYSAGWNFRQFFYTPFGALVISWHSGKILRWSSRGTPPPVELNTRGVAKYSDFGPIDGYISETVQDRR